MIGCFKNDTFCSFYKNEFFMKVLSRGRKHFLVPASVNNSHQYCLQVLNYSLLSKHTIELSVGKGDFMMT